MANKKIDQFNEASGINSGDLMIIEDASETKKININSLRTGFNSVFVVYAEEEGPLSDDAFEYTFGADGSPDSDNGFVFAFDSQLIGMGYNVNKTASTNAATEIVKNGVDQGPTYEISAENSTEKTFKVFDAPLSFNAGDNFNFKTTTGSVNVDYAIVSAFFKTNLQF